MDPNFMTHMMTGFSDQVIFREIFDNIKSYTKDAELSMNFIVKIIFCILNVIFIISIKYIITNPGMIKDFISKTFDNVTTYFINTEELPYEDVKNRLFVKKILSDRTIYNNFIMNDNFSNKKTINFLSLTITKTAGKTIVIVIKYYYVHRKFLASKKKLIDKSYEKYLKRLSSQEDGCETMCYTAQSTGEKSFNFVKYHPNQMYETEWYKKLLRSINQHISICKGFDCFTPLAILINGEPGLGKTKFADFIARKRICNTVTKIDMTRLLKISFSETMKKYFSDGTILKDPISKFPNIVIIDELDKYLEYYLNYKYNLELSEYIKTKNEKPFTNEKDYIKNAKLDFLYEILALIETENHYKKYIFIFCANNFDSIFEGVDMRHFTSLKKRFLSFNFERCNYKEIVGYVNFYNNILKIENVDEKLRGLRKDVTIPFRDLTQLMFMSQYQIEELVNQLNKYENKNVETVSETKIIPRIMIQRKKSICDLLKSNPDLPWKYEYISTNKTLNIEYVIENLDKDWDWSYICQNEGITVNELLNYKNKIKNIDYLSYREDITKDIIKEHKDIHWDVSGMDFDESFDLDFLKYLKNERGLNCSYRWYTLIKITVDDIINNPDIPCNNISIAENNNLSVDDCIQLYKKNIIIDLDKLYGKNGISIKHIKENPDIKWDYYLFSKFVKIEEIDENPDFPWDWTGVSVNKNLTIDFILKYKVNLIIKYVNVTNISWEDIIKNIDIGWCIEELAAKPMTIEILLKLHEKFKANNFIPATYDVKLTIDNILNNKHIKWDFKNLTNNLYLNIEDFLKNSDLDWDWRTISKKITIELLNKYPNVWNKLDDNNLSDNPNIKLQFVLDNPKFKWNWEYLSRSLSE